LGKSGYARQLSIYFRDGEHRKAYDLAKAFVKDFPKDMVSHFALSKSAFWLGEHTLAAKEGRKAFNLAKNAEDLRVCALLTASAYYELGEFRKGSELLSSIEEPDPRIETLRFVFSLAIGDKGSALSHAKALLELDPKGGAGIIRRFVSDTNKN